MVKGGIMWFDDYELEGARRAIKELIGDDKLIFSECGFQRCYAIF